MTFREAAIYHMLFCKENKTREIFYSFLYFSSLQYE
jgi:hypothetical protein